MTTNLDEKKILQIVWLALGAITLTSWWVGSSHGEEQFTRNTAISYAVLLIAGVKVRLIVSYFMEVRHASLRLRRWMGGWLLFTIVALLAIYTLQLSIPPI
jgi:apolipoprotein N-acyltransferase